MSSLLDEKSSVQPIQPMLNLVPSVVILALLLDGKIRFRDDDFSSTIFFYFCSIRNIAHGSDAEKSAEREISLWFRADELTTWQQTTEKWIYE